MNGEKALMPELKRQLAEFGLKIRNGVMTPIGNLGGRERYVPRSGLNCQPIREELSRRYQVVEDRTKPQLARPFQRGVSGS